MTCRKITYALLLAAFPAPAFALDFTPDATRIVSDPTYLPLQGQVYGSTGYQYGKVTADQANYLGARNYSYSDRVQYINQALAYGITDDITIRATDTYVSNEKEAFSTGQRYSFDGLEDPTFGATWRALDQRNYPVSVDLTASYMPDLINNKYATSTSTGSVARGGDEGTGQVALNYETRSFTIQGWGGATYYGNTKYYTPATGGTGTTSSYWAYFTGVATQTRLTNVISINVGDRYTTFDNENWVSSTGTPYTLNQGGVNDFYVALNYHIIPNRLVAGITYDYFLNGDNRYTYANPTLDTTNKSERENLFGVRLQYVFF